MSGETMVLIGVAATIGVVHTILGPDHYLPFVVLSRARHWTRLRTTVITVLCGVGHVLGSVILGAIGIALGIAVFKLEAIESYRGEVAAWFLIAFGLTYLAWGVHRAVRNRPHTHFHMHADGQGDSHLHTHSGGHAHAHVDKPGSLVPWGLFIFFVLGPCEPLIPVLMYPAAKNDMASVAAVASVYGVTTIATMVGVVLVTTFGLSKLSLGRFEKYSHAVAGLVILLAGVGVKFLGL